MMTPIELLDYMVEKLGLKQMSICDLHTSCINPQNSTCRSGNYCLVNFDNVKTIYCSKQHMASCKSVDGLGCSNGTLCFVEIKGWKKFIAYNPNANESHVRRQVESYDFANKFRDSVEICRYFAQDDGFLENNNVVYVIVTDISVKTNPLLALQENLNVLSCTSSTMDNICNKYMIPKIKGIQDVKTYYKQCSEFDIFWKSL